MTFSSIPDQRVMAIRDGEVTYIGNQMKSLGEIIIIKHSLGFYSTYTQLRNIKISLGDKVKKGQIIGLSSNKSFYFEMKKYDQHIDPSIYINF
jgi:lipoprotein NlpD